MTIPQWALLAFAVWTLLFLFGTIGAYRWSRILTGRASISEWQADVHQGNDWYRRAMRAHMNCVENLAIFGAIVFCATTAGTDGRWFDLFAVAIIVARVFQTLVHVSVPAIECRSVGAVRALPHSSHGDACHGSIRGPFSDRSMTD